MKIAIIGANGRMGQSLIKALNENLCENTQVELCAAIVRKGNRLVGMQASEKIKFTSDIKQALDSADAIIDFTLPNYSVKIAKLAAQKNRKIIYIIGTTGFSKLQLNMFGKLAKKIPIVISGNFSLGVNVLAMLVSQAATMLREYDIEIFEAHHKNKIDAPSGTALLLGESAAKARKINLAKNSQIVRNGKVGVRKKNIIGFSSMRGGGIIGEHNVMLASDSEILELQHRALNRDLFAKGAIVAALWARGKKPRIYDMQDVLHIKSGEKLRKK